MIKRFTVRIGTSRPALSVPGVAGRQAGPRAGHPAAGPCRPRAGKSQPWREVVELL